MDKAFGLVAHCLRAKKASKVTRNSEKDPLLGFGSDTRLANDTQLALNSAVLRRILGIRHQVKSMPIRDICSKIFYEELYPLWEQPTIPVKPAKKCIDQLVSLNNKFLVMKKIPVIRQKSKNYESRLIEFENGLHCLCELAPTDLKDVMRR